MKKKINNWKKSDLSCMTDLTYYNKVSTDGWELEIAQEYISNNVVAWARLQDAEEYEFEEIFEDSDYFCDIEEGCVLATGRYTGTIKIVIKNIEDETVEERELPIVSRFYNIDTNKLRETVLEEKEEWSKLKKRDKKAELEIKIGTQIFYDFAALYEAYVKIKIKEAAKSDWKIEDVTKKVFSEKEECKWLSKKREIRTANDDVYLDGELIPDIVLYNEKTGKYIIYDVKYKYGTYNQGTRSDRLQILAYAYMWDCEQIGHIFPEKENLTPLVIQCERGVSVSYKELKCNTEDSFDLEKLF